MYANEKPRHLANNTNCRRVHCDVNSFVYRVGCSDCHGLIINMTNEIDGENNERIKV